MVNGTETSNKYRLLFFAFLVLITTSSCGILEQAAEAERFAQCNFFISNAQIRDVAGINLASVHSETDLNMSQMLQIGNALIQGEVPATVYLTLSAHNDEAKKASIAGMDWEVYMKGTQYASGTLNERVEVLPGQTAEFPLEVSFDLLKLVTSDRLPDIIALITDNNRKERLKKLDMKVKIRPWYVTSGGQVKTVPAYITVRP